MIKPPRPKSTRIKETTSLPDSVKAIISSWDFDDKPYSEKDMRAAFSLIGTKAQLFRIENGRAGTKAELRAFEPQIDTVHDWLMEKKAKDAALKELFDQDVPSLEAGLSLPEVTTGISDIKIKVAKRVQEYMQVYDIKNPNHVDMLESLVRQKFRLEDVQLLLASPGARRRMNYKDLVSEEEKLEKQIRATEDSLGITMMKQRESKENLGFDEIIDGVLDQIDEFLADTSMVVPLTHCNEDLGWLYLINLQEHGARLEFVCPKPTCPEKGKKLILEFKPNPRPGEKNL